MNHLRETNACYKCLQTNHKAHACKARLKCTYCHQAGKKNTNHNTALCAQLNDKEFADVIKTKLPGNKAEACQAGKEAVTTNKDISEQPIIVEGRVYATYNEFMKFINSSEQYDDKDEYEEDEYEDNDSEAQVYTTSTEASNNPNKQKVIDESAFMNSVLPLNPQTPEHMNLTKNPSTICIKKNKSLKLDMMII